MGKHKKLLRSEKAKVKLKGNKLSKAQNVTKTEFRVKKIIIKDQISEININEEGKKQHNLKEVLTKLKHHNPSFRLDALKALKDQISNGLNLDLGVTIQNLSAMCLDIERDVRRESFKVMTILFSMISRVHLEPFFEVILSYLSCAMTHIQQNIQDDSLYMLDILLKFQPKLMAIYSDKIFNNFLDMISKVTNSQSRSLVISMGNKMSTVKWRSKILQRLNELLKTIKIITDSNYKNIENNDKNNEDKFEYFISTKPMHFPLYRHNLISSAYSVSKLLNKPLAEKNKTINDDEKLKGYIDHLIPLLLQSWLEVAPLNNNEISNIDAALTLKQILEIFESLWELTELQCNKTNNHDLLHWFQNKYYDEFQMKIFHKFPYQQTESLEDHKKKSNKNKDKELSGSGGQFCIFQNLTMIYLYCALGSNKIQSDNERIDKILNFLKNTLSKLKTFTIDEQNYLEKTLKMVLLTKSTQFMKVDANKTRFLLKSILNLLNGNDSSNKEFKNKMLVLVSNIILDDYLYKFYGITEFKNWISTLPKILCKPQITQNSIYVLVKLAKQNNEEFLIALNNNSFNIIDNLSNIHIFGCKDQQNGKKLILDLFYWIKTWSQEDKVKICEYFQTYVNDNELFQYFRFIIK